MVILPSDCKSSPLKSHAATVVVCSGDIIALQQPTLKNICPCTLNIHTKYWPHRWQQKYLVVSSNLLPLQQSTMVFLDSYFSSMSWLHPWQIWSLLVPRPSFRLPSLSSSELQHASEFIRYEEFVSRRAAKIITIITGMLDNASCNS
ncbi:hypothetical protein ACP70R_019031 [Stipagrostis hirtigluma subsp. patula]